MMPVDMMLASPNIVRIQARGSRPPLLWIDPCPEIVPLVRALGIDQPFIGLSIDDLRRGDNLNQYAAEIVSTICAELPGITFNLGGLCTAGILAYEIADQLRAKGRIVPLVILLDAINPAVGLQTSRTRSFWCRTAFHVQQSIRHGEGNRPRYLLGMLKGVAIRFGLAQPAPLPWPIDSVRADIERVAYAYSAPASDGDVLFIRPHERAASDDRSISWRDVVRGHLEVHDTPGSHVTMMRYPWITSLAKRVREALLEACPPNPAPNMAGGHGAGERQLQVAEGCTP